VSDMVLWNETLFSDILQILHSQLSNFKFLYFISN